jgi:DNA-binding beta-propeller fold protein YncE
VSVPETKANTGGEIDVVDPTTFKTTKILPVKECSSHGIVFGPNQQLLLGCSQDAILADSVAHTLVLDVTTGNITETVNGIGGADQVAYNPTLNWYYVAAYQDQVNGSATGAPDPKVAVIDAATGALIQTIKTDNVTAHAVAVDPNTNKMIVPLTASGIAIFDLVNGTVTATESATGATSTPTASATKTAGAAARGGGGSVALLVLLVGAAVIVGMA